MLFAAILTLIGLHSKKILGLTPEVMEKMTFYKWPGNVRELRNSIEHAFVLCASGGIGVQHLLTKIVGASRECVEPPKKNSGSFHGKKETLMRALRESGGNQSQAARILGVSRVTVWKQIKKFGIRKNPIVAPLLQTTFKMGSPIKELVK